jgi:inner membrane protein
MDPLTHTAAGLFLSRVGLKRWTPLATPIVLLSANAPDIDIVTLTGGPLSYLHYHRHLTHSLLAMPVVALLTVVLVRVAGRKTVHWTGAFFAALVAVATHLLLDLTNTYGIRLFLPFSENWLRLDLINVFDLWIWGVFLICISGPFLGRLVGSEIGSRSLGPQPLHGRGFAWLALAFLLLYTCGRGVLHARAVAELDSRIYEESMPLRTLAVPGPANPWRWRGVVETGEFFAVGDVDLLANFDPTHTAIFRKPPPDPAIQAAAQTLEFREFLRFSQVPLWRVSPAADVENGKVVEVIDLRFGTPLAPAFMVSATMNSTLQPVSTSFQFGLNRKK